MRTPEHGPISSSFRRHLAAIAFLTAFAGTAIFAGCFGNQDDSLLDRGSLTGISQTGSSAGYGTLSGYVVSDSSNNLAAPSFALASTPNVKITLLESGAFTYTNQSGYFTIPNVRPGTYTVLASRNDAAGTRFVNSFTAQVAADRNNELPSSITLKRSCSVTGKVVTSDGSPFSSFRVFVDGLPAYAITDSEGYFTLEGAPGNQSFRLGIMKSGFTTRYLGPFDVLAGKTYAIGEDIVLTVAAGQTAATIISGKITAAAGGTAIPNALVRIMDASGQTAVTAAATIADSAGNYSATVTANRKYSVEISHDNFYTYSRQITSAGEAALYVNAALARSSSGIELFAIGGAVKDAETNQPLYGANISTRPSYGTAAADSSGRYSLLLPSGGFELTVSIAGYPSKTVMIDTRTTSEVAFTLSKKGASAPLYVFGLVYDTAFNPQPRAKVSIDKTSLYTYTNQYGNYSFYLPAGNYGFLAVSSDGYAGSVSVALTAPGQANIKINK